jgi:hypothetical protein
MCRARAISGAAGPYHDGVVDWDAGCPLVAEVTALSAKIDRKCELPQHNFGLYFYSIQAAVIAIVLYPHSSEVSPPLYFLITALLSYGCWVRGG